MSLKDKEFFAPIADHLEEQLSTRAPKTAISTRDVNMNGLVMSGLTVKSEGIHEPRMCFVRRNGMIEVGMATNASENTFAKVGDVAPDTDPRRLVEAVAHDAITLDATRRIRSAAETYRRDVTDISEMDPRMLGFATKVVRQWHPDTDISLPAGGESVRAGNFTAEKRDDGWASGKRRLTSPMNAVVFVAASDAAERIAAAYTHPVESLGCEGVSLSQGLERSLVK